jgi:hypothetical protein
VKPEGRIILQEATVQNANGTHLKTVEKFQSVLRITGWTNIQEATPVSLTDAVNLLMFGFHGYELCIRCLATAHVEGSHRSIRVTATAIEVTSF